MNGRERRAPVTANNYTDRHVLGVLAPQLMETFGWSAVDYRGIEHRYLGRLPLFLSQRFGL